MITLRPKGTGGAVWNIWSFNEATSSVRLRLVFGSALPVDVEVPVCSASRPKVGHYLISKRTEGWELASAIYIPGGWARGIPVHADVPIDFYWLSYPSMPDDAALEKL